MRRGELVRKLVDDEVVCVLEGGVHRLAIHDEWLRDEEADGNDDDEREYDEDDDLLE